MIGGKGALQHADVECAPIHSLSFLCGPLLFLSQKAGYVGFQKIACFGHAWEFAMQWGCSLEDDVEMATKKANKWRTKAILLRSVLEYEDSDGDCLHCTERMEYTLTQ